MVRAPRTCPVPGFDLSFGDCVLWKARPWVINSMHYRMDDGRPAASLVRYGNAPAQDAEAIAPLDELRVFDDAQPWQLPNSTGQPRAENQ